MTFLTALALDYEAHRFIIEKKKNQFPISQAELHDQTMLTGSQLLSVSSVTPQRHTRAHTLQNHSHLNPAISSSTGCC